MKKGRQDFSVREQRLVEGFIADVFHTLHLPDQSGELCQCAWAAFLSVYREDPEAFYGTGLSGWSRAYETIRDALTQAKKENDFGHYRQTSLDQAVNSEIQEPRIKLLQMPHGDFQNSVCFHDYLHHMDEDVCRMAYSLINGDTVEEARVYYDWSCDHAAQTYHDLRAEIEEYLAI